MKLTKTTSVKKSGEPIKTSRKTCTDETAKYQKLKTAEHEKISSAEKTDKAKNAKTCAMIEDEMTRPSKLEIKTK